MALERKGVPAVCHPKMRGAHGQAGRHSSQRHPPSSRAHVSRAPLKEAWHDQAVVTDNAVLVDSYSESAPIVAVCLCGKRKNLEEGDVTRTVR